METLSQRVAAWALGPAVTGLPQAARTLACQAVLDTLGVTLLGSRMPAPRILAVTELARGVQGAATLVGLGRRADPQTAALVNGCSAHVDLFDDNNGPMIAHPSSPLVSALLPLAQARAAAGRAFLDAYAVGFEFGVAMGRALNPAFYQRGWHLTYTLGILGATLACCRLIGLDARRAGHALGIAATMSGGLRQNFGTMSMGLHVGLAARGAVQSALLAEAGYESDPAALEGKYGFLQVFAGAGLAELPLGKPFELVASGIIFKPYPSGAPTLAAVDAALALHGRLKAAGMAASTLTAVRCLVHPWNAMTLREEVPADELQAKVNLRYCVATALVHGDLSFRRFSRAALGDAAVFDLMRRISIAIADDLPDNDEFPAEVRAVLADGHELVERRERPPGGTARPFSQAELEAKFRDCAQLVLEPDGQGQVIDLVMGLDAQAGLESLCTLLQGTRTPDLP